MLKDGQARSGQHLHLRIVPNWFGELVGIHFSQLWKNLIGVTFAAVENGRHDVAHLKTHSLSHRLHFTE